MSSWWPPPTYCSSCLWALSSDSSKMPGATAAILQWWEEGLKQKHHKDGCILMSLWSNWINQWLYLDLLCEGLLYTIVHFGCLLYLQPKQPSSIDISFTAGFISFLEIMWLVHAFAIRATSIYATAVLLSSLYLMIKWIDLGSENNTLTVVLRKLCCLSERSLCHVSKWHKSFDSFVPLFDKVS